MTTSKYEKMIHKKDIRQKTYNIFINLMPIVSLLSFVILLILRLYDYALLGIYILLPMLSAPLIFNTYFKIKKIETASYFVFSEKRIFLISTIIFFVSMTFSIISLYQNEIRTHGYYLLIVISSLAILINILTLNKNNSINQNLILTMIVLLSLNIIWGVNLKYFYYFGRTDIFAHRWYIENLIVNGFITQELGLYNSFPLFHLMCSSFYYITGLTAFTHKTMFIICGVAYSALLLLIYKISSKIFFDKRLSLITALFACLNVDFIITGMYSLPRSIIVFLLILTLFLLLNNKNITQRILVIFLIIPIVLYHTISMPYIFLIYITIYLINIIYEKKDIFFGKNYFIILIAITLSYWMYNANLLFEMLIKEIVESSPKDFSSSSLIYFPLSELINYMQYAPLMFFLILGFLFSLKEDNISPIGRTFCIVGFVLAFVSFPGPVLLVDKLVANLGITRIGQYSFVFITFCASLGFYYSYIRSNRSLKTIFVILFIILSFTAISNDFVASDNPLVKRPFFTFYFNEEEVLSIDTVVKHSNGYVMSDFVVTRYLSFSQHASKSHILEYSKESNMVLKKSYDDIILIRNGELNKRPLRIYPSKSNYFEMNPPWNLNSIYLFKNEIVWDNLDILDKIFNSGQMSAYY